MAGMKWNVEFYQRSNGRCPTREFLSELTAQERVFADRAFDRLETYGHELRRPHVDNLRDGIWELRVKTPDSGLRFLYFFFDGRKIVVTHGFKKKTRAVPPGEIETAIRCRVDYLERQKQGEAS